MKCDFCEEDKEVTDGVKLTGCKHFMCKNCMTSLVEATIDEFILCPCIVEETNNICDKLIPNKDIQASVPDDVYNSYLQKSLDVFENDSKEVILDKEDPEDTDHKDDKEETIPELETPNTFTCISCSTEYDIHEKAYLFDSSESFCKKCILKIINNSNKDKNEKPTNTFVCDICTDEYDVKEKVDLDDITKSFCKMCISKIVKNTKEEKTPKTFKCTICCGKFDICEKAVVDDICKSFCKTCVANIVKKSTEVKQECPYPCCNPSTGTSAGYQHNPAYQPCRSGQRPEPMRCPTSQVTYRWTGHYGRKHHHPRGRQGWGGGYC